MFAFWFDRGKAQTYNFVFASFIHITYYSCFVLKICFCLWFRCLYVFPNKKKFSIIYNHILDDKNIVKIKHKTFLFADSFSNMTLRMYYLVLNIYKTFLQNPHAFLSSKLNYKSKFYIMPSFPMCTIINIIQ